MNHQRIQIPFDQEIEIDFDCQFKYQDFNILILMPMFQPYGK